MGTPEDVATERHFTPPEIMDNVEYLRVQGQIILLASIVKDMPLTEFIEAGVRADIIGPFLDPTLWRAGQENLAVIIDLARGLKAFQEKAKKATLQ